MTQITLLNAMAGREFESALDQQCAWGIPTLDLKDSIFGKGIADLTDAEAETAAQMIQQRGLSIACLSPVLFHDAIEKGEAFFRREHLAKLDRVLAIAALLPPRFIRLLAATTNRRAELSNCIPYLQADHPWVFSVYADAVERIARAGFQATIENEVGGCLLSTPEEIRGLFALLERGQQVCLTWDVQNLWQMGTFPSLEVYTQLMDLIGYYHLKGGQCEEPTCAGPQRALRWRSPLETASWPVAEITRQVIRDGVSPVICLNPSHGAPKPGEAQADFTQRDLEFVNKLVAESAP